MNKFCSVLGIIILGIVNIYSECCSDGSCRTRGSGKKKTEEHGKRSLGNHDPKLKKKPEVKPEEEEKLQKEKEEEVKLEVVKLEVVKPEEEEAKKKKELEDVFHKYYRLTKGSTISSVKVCESFTDSEESIKKSGEKPVRVYIKIGNKLCVFIIKGDANYIEEAFKGGRKPCPLKEVEGKLSNGKGSVIMWYNSKGEFFYTYYEF